MENVINDGRPGSSNGPAPSPVPENPLKKEVLSKADKEKNEFIDFMAHVKTELRTFQEMDIGIRTLLGKLQHAKYASDLQGDVSKYLSRIGNICKILSSCCVEPMKQAEFHKLKAAIASVLKENANLKEYAVKFGVVDKMGIRKRKKIEQ